IFAATFWQLFFLSVSPSFVVCVCVFCCFFVPSFLAPVCSLTYLTYQKGIHRMEAYDNAVFLLSYVTRGTCFTREGFSVEFCPSVLCMYTRIDRCPPSDLHIGHPGDRI
ncbi:unnamed protein product, partial [Ectocarpus sp. 4 AP-2014]